MPPKYKGRLIRQGVTTMFLGNGKNAANLTWALLTLPFMLVALFVRAIYRALKKMLCVAAAKKKHGKESVK